MYIKLKSNLMKIFHQMSVIQDYQDYYKYTTEI